MESYHSKISCQRKQQSVFLHQSLKKKKTSISQKLAIGLHTDFPQYEFKEYETTSEYPKGCYVFVGKNDVKGYFNMHSSGSAESRSRAICKTKEGT